MIKPERTGKLKRGTTAEECESGIAHKKQKSSIDSGYPEDGTSTPGFSKQGGGNGAQSHRKDREKPAELFRKDLISAMKMADTEPLQQDDYIVITDPWRMDWEKGVQVPVHPDEMPHHNVRIVQGKENWHGLYSFKLPRKYLHATHDITYRQGIHELHEMHQLADQVCRYDLDELDVAWLALNNIERELMGDLPVEEWVMERVFEEIETHCHNNMQTMIKTVDGLGIEYDENVVCDVCRSPESEDCNEMVFCDSCDICVHQACYGIQKIPEGSWLCRVCALGIQPHCILCPNTGGAMKSTRSGSKWAHVSCALWIPEVSIGCPEKMEPITKISHIPSSRWALTCSLCRDRTGACIQCAVKTCKTAFHVTCAIQHSLDMKTILDDKNDDVQLKAYCEKHTKKKEGEGTPRKNEGAGKGIKKECGMTEQEKNELRSHRLEKLAKEFYLCVQAKDVAQILQLDEDMVDFIYNYWMLKRRANFNKPLLMPKMEEEDRLSKQQENSLLARMKMFVHLRQDLERVRNLCYMVSRREKLRRQLYHLKQQIFDKQVQLINSSDLHSFATRDKKALVGAHRLTDSVYDQPDGILRMARLAEITAAEADAAYLVADGGAPTRERHHHGRRHHDRGNDPIMKVTAGDVCVSNRTRHFSDCLNEITTPEKIIGSGNMQSQQRDDTSQTVSQKVKKLRSPLQKAQEVVTSHSPDATAAATTRSSRLHKLSHSPHVYRNNNNSRYNGIRHKHRKRHGFGTLMGKCEPDRRAGFSGQRRKRNGVVIPGNRRLVVGDNIREKVQSRLQNSTKPYSMLNGIRQRVQRKIENFFQRSEDSSSNAELKENEPIVAANDLSPSGKTDKSSGTGVIDCDLFHRNIFSDAIHGNASPFSQIAKQAGFGSGVPAADGGATTPSKSANDSAGTGTSEARRLRRKVASNMEAGNSCMLYDNAIGEAKPSCNSTPEQSLSSKEVTFSPFGKKLLPRTNDSETDLSEDDVSDIGSEGDSTIIAEDVEDNDSTRNVFLSLRSLRSKSQRIEAVADDLSVDGSNASSSSRYSTRSRLADSWSKITGACS